MRKRMVIDYEKFDSYESILAKTGCRSHSKRGLTIDVLRMHPEEWVSPSDIAKQILITPRLGNRGGEKCTPKHIMADMNVDDIGGRMIRSGCDWRLIKGRQRLALVLLVNVEDWLRTYSDAEIAVRKIPNKEDYHRRLAKGRALEPHIKTMQRKKLAER